jgi:ribonuclease P/MRP protein subunit POP3
MSHVDVGFNCITKNLQAQSQPIPNPEDNTGRQRRYSVVFVARGDQSAAFNCHFPQMVGASTRSLPDADKTRLVGFSRACSEKLSRCLGIPRVSSVALVADAPGAMGVQELVRSTIPAIDVPWLPVPQAEDYRHTKINSIQTTVGNKKMRVA